MIVRGYSNLRPYRPAIALEKIELLNICFVHIILLVLTLPADINNLKMTDVFRAIIKTIQKKNKPAQMHGVMVFPLSTWVPDDAKKSQLWLSETKKTENKNINSMHSFSGELPLSPIEITELIGRTWPFIRECYQLWDYTDPYLHGGFTIHYSEGGDKSLSLHRDDCLYTINICLHSTASGTELVFRKSLYGCVRLCSVNLQSGELLIHQGNHAHETAPLIKGERTNLILWIDAKKIAEKI